MGYIRNRFTLAWLLIVAIILLLPAYHQGTTASKVNAQQPPGANTTVYLPLIIGPNPFQGPPQLPATVTDMNGDTVTIESVERIIGLNGDITEIIFALGLGDQVVAADISATYPAQARQLPKIGYQRGLNAEAIINFRPTVVVGKQGAGPPPVLVQLRQAGLTLAMTNDGVSLDTPAEKIRFVAQTLGVPARGAMLIEQLDADFAAAEAALQQVNNQPKPRVIFLYLRQGEEGNQRLVFGANTATSTMITAAGGIDAAAEIGISGVLQPITTEALIATQPDVILVFESGLAEIGGEEGLLALPGIAQTPAGQNRRIVAMDGQYLAGMNPRTGKALLDLIGLLYP